MGGGLWDKGSGAYYEGMEPCDDGSTNDAPTGDEKTDDGSGGARAPPTLLAAALLAGCLSDKDVLSNTRSGGCRGERIEAGGSHSMTVGSVGQNVVSLFIFVIN